MTRAHFTQLRGIKIDIFGLRSGVMVQLAVLALCAGNCRKSGKTGREAD